MKKRIGIITYNINKGLSPFRKLGVLPAIVDVLKGSDADLACLQEVWEEEGISENALETLTRKVWSHWVYDRNAVFPGGAQGNAVLSRFGVLNWRNVDVSVENSEIRRFLDVRVLLEEQDRELAVICVHFGLKETERRTQVDRLLDHLSSTTLEKDPVIVAGDFNDWRSITDRRLRKVSGLKNVLRETGASHAKTFPSSMPVFSLDRVYYKNLEPVRAGVLRDVGRKGLSDHLPVLAEFKVP